MVPFGTALQSLLRYFQPRMESSTRHRDHCLSAATVLKCLFLNWKELSFLVFFSNDLTMPWAFTKKTSAIFLCWPPHHRKHVWCSLKTSPVKTEHLQFLQQLLMRNQSLVLTILSLDALHLSASSPKLSARVTWNSTQVSQPVVSVRGG